MRKTLALNVLNFIVYTIQNHLSVKRAGRSRSVYVKSPKLRARQSGQGI